MLSQGRDLAGPAELFAPNSANSLTQLKDRTRISGWKAGHDFGASVRAGLWLESPALGSDDAMLRLTKSFWGPRAILRVDGRDHTVPFHVNERGACVDLPNGNRVTMKMETNYTHGQTELLVNVADPMAEVSVEFRFNDQIQPQVTRAEMRDGEVLNAVELRAPVGAILGDYLAIHQQNGATRTVFDPLGAYRSVGTSVAPVNDFTANEAAEIKVKVLNILARVIEPG